MLVIRFLRAGKRNQPFYKIVVTDKKNPPRGGRFNEQVGFWNPLTKEKKLDAEKIKKWMKNGAKPSATVFNLLVKEKIVEGKKIAVHKKSKKPVAASQSEASLAPEGAGSQPMAETPKAEAPKESAAEGEPRQEGREIKKEPVSGEAKEPKLEETKLKDAPKLEEKPKV
jgi:small subunit ribosomal protein S16